MRAHNVAVRPDTGDQDPGAMRSGSFGDDVDGVPKGVGQPGCFSHHHFKHAGIPPGPVYDIRVLRGLRRNRGVVSWMHGFKLASRQ